MVFNVTFNNISVISWWSVLLVEETGVPVETDRPVASHWQTVSHNVVSPERDSNLFRKQFKKDMEILEKLTISIN